MGRRTSPNFEKEYKRLPRNIQQQVDQAFVDFAENRWQTSLNYKRPRKKDRCTIRVNDNYRMIGIFRGEFRDGNVVWYSVCSHDACDKKIKRF